MPKPDPHKDSNVKGKIVIKVFNSFEEAELSEIQAVLGQAPIERVRRNY